VKLLKGRTFSEIRQSARFDRQQALRQQKGLGAMMLSGEFFIGLGMMCVIEGLLFLGFPAGVRRMMAVVIASPDQAMRTSGMISAVFGLVVIWIVRQLSG